MTMRGSMSITINQWQLISEENRLVRGEEEIILQPLCIKVLALLARHPGQVLSREILIKQVWSGRVVSEDALNNCIKKIRKALKDDPKAPNVIQTIPKRGYRLIAQTRPKVEPKSEVKTEPEQANEKELNAGGYSSKFRWLVAAVFLVSSLVTVAKQLPISMEVIEITEDMTEAEKQKQYERIMQQTEQGGHIIKLDIKTTEKLDG
jgi:DNA-binding winged helix-turn-helix (wHTH) protein